MLNGATSEDDLEVEQDATVRFQSVVNGIKMMAEDKLQPQRDPPILSPRPRSEGLFSGQVIGCIFCDKPHPSQDCYLAQRMSLQDKKSTISKKKCCFTCLKIGHRSTECRVAVRCGCCGKKHYTVMCPDSAINKVARVEEERNQVQPQQQSSVSCSNSCSKEVLLKSLLVRVLGAVASKVVRLVFDDGNQKSYVKKSTANSLQFEVMGEEWIRNALFGGTVTSSRKHERFAVCVESLDGKVRRNLILVEEEVICGRIPRVPHGSWIERLAKKKITLSDFGSESADVEILIGSDQWGNLMTGRMFHLGNGLVAVESIFGWTLSGPVPSDDDESSAMMVTSLWAGARTEADLWNLEAIGIHDPADFVSRDEKEAAAREHFSETISREEDGRYTVGLPWMDTSQKVQNNRLMAEKRLASATLKILKEDKFLEYGQIFEQWKNEGIIEEVMDSDEMTESHFLPHRPVFKPESKTTPIRPVFDASCKSGRSPSLNDCLEKGPNLMELIPSVLLRFREKKVGVSSDIRKAFQMINIREEDRNYLKFLWWEDYSKKKFKVYRHSRVVFGVNCSPFQLAAVIQHHLTGCQDSRKDSALQLLESLYVDNCVTSVNSEEEYSKFKEESTQLMDEARMELRQWERSADGSDNSEDSCSTILGLIWDKQMDLLSCVIPEEELPETITKRNILSVIQKIYDPLGILTPALVAPKLLIQKAWAEKVKWDDPLGSDYRITIIKWWKEVHCLENIHIPRHFAEGASESARRELHMFCDASKYAYGAVVFMRTEEEGKVSVQLLQSKTRVAPLKIVTIPRLELLSCTIGARLLASVVKALKMDSIPTFFWTDSSTALAWIQRNDEWGTFVGNRVKEITKLTNPLSWNHVPGTLNPADLPSRGCSPQQLLDSRWWEGPAWLKSSRESWPCGNISVDEVVVGGERKKSISTSMTTVEGGNPWYAKFSSHAKNVRIMAWILRIFRRNEQPGLSIKEIDEAETRIFKLVQNNVFKNDKEIGGLQVIRDKDGILRVKTKLIYRQDSQEFRLPIILPNSHPTVQQLIEETHKLFGHCGTQFLMGKLREKVWILGGRRAIKKVVNQCTTCRRFQAKRLESIPASLPENRVKDGKAFQITGVDLAGPLYLKGGTKIWIVLFTCAIFRCVHLETVSKLTTDEFLLAFMRFVSRRGRPTTIYSDNGTNFVGADNLFAKLDWTHIEEETRCKRIQWIFNPPTAAWWGGWWERLIRSVKDLLKRILGNKKLNRPTLETCLCEVEAVINGRPLTFVTEDPNDLIPLTPSMFLQDQMETEFPEVKILDATQFHRKYRDFKEIKEQLKQRFRTEYLGLLVQRGKEKKCRVIKVGDVVLVGDDNKKRLEWLMGRIVEVFPGKDGQVRTASVKTTLGGIMLRPIQRLYPMEVEDESYIK